MSAEEQLEKIKRALYVARETKALLLKCGFEATEVDVEISRLQKLLFEGTQALAKKLKSSN